MRIINQHCLPGVVLADARQCVEVSSSGRYEFGSRCYIAAGTDPGDYGSIQIAWSPGPCPIAGGQIHIRGAQSRGGWRSAWGVIEIDEGDMAGGIAAAELSLFSVRLSSADRFDMLYDGAWLSPEGTPLFADGFE